MKTKILINVKELQMYSEKLRHKIGLAEARLKELKTNLKMYQEFLKLIKKGEESCRKSHTRKS